MDADDAAVRGGGGGGGGGLYVGGPAVASSPSGATIGSDIDARPGLGRQESYTNPQEAADHGDGEEGAYEEDTFTDINTPVVAPSGIAHQLSAQGSMQDESLDELNDILSVQSNTTIGSDVNYSEVPTDANYSVGPRRCGHSTFRIASPRGALDSPHPTSSHPNLRHPIFDRAR